MVELHVELHARPSNALLEDQGSLLTQQQGDAFQCFELGVGLRLQLFEVGRLIEVAVDIFCTLTKGALEELSSPLNSVLDFVRKVLKRADGNRFLLWVTAGAIGFCQVRHYHLSIALCPQRSTVDQGFLEVDAALIHVQTSIDVI